jgi:HAT1-interacting factor 1
MAEVNPEVDLSEQALPVFDQATPEWEKSLNERTTEAAHAYAKRNFESAADLYSEALELRVQVHGDQDPDNADLLFGYGRSLYQVGIAKSDVLGAEKTDGEQKVKKSKVDTGVGEGSSKSAAKDEAIGEALVEKITPKPSGGNSLFQIDGDENWADEDDDSEGEDGEEDADELTDAWATLELAKLGFHAQLNTLNTAAINNERTLEQNEKIRTLKSRIADTHEYLAEISLESEQFPAAVGDLSEALKLNEELYEKDNAILSSLHFKMSLALEFASQTQEKGSEIVQELDAEQRKLAATHMEMAIESCKLRITKEEGQLEKLDSESKEAKDKIASIKDVSGMVKEMEERLKELKEDPMSLNQAGPGGVAGILGGILGETSPESKARTEEAVKGANDISGMVKKKKKPIEQEEVEVVGKGKGRADAPPVAVEAAGASNGTSNGNGKRKAEDDSHSKSERTKVPKMTTVEEVPDKDA